MKSFAILSFSIFVVYHQALGKDAVKNSTIPVSLFGSSCVFQGPWTKKQLESIHSISPSQIYPEDEPFLTSIDETKKTLSVVNNSKTLSKKLGLSTADADVLNSYILTIETRLNQQLRFLEKVKTLEDSRRERKDTNFDPLFDLVKVYSRDTRELKRVETLIKKLATLNKRDREYQPTVMELYRIYNNSIEKEPQEKFQQAVRAVKSQYNCLLEDEDEDEQAD